MFILNIKKKKTEVFIFCGKFSKGGLNFQCIYNYIKKVLRGVKIIQGPYLPN